MENKFRRESDKDSMLLVLLGERVSTMQETLSRLVDRQGNNPCKTNELRIRYLEKIMYGIVSAVFLLTLKAILSFFP